MIRQPKRSGLQTIRSSALERWRSLGLFRRFGVSISAVLVVGMALIGAWVAKHVEDAVIQSVGVGVALNTNSLLLPDVQSLKHATELSTDQLAELDRRLAVATNPHAIVAFHIWKGEFIVASSDRSMIGRSFPVTAARGRAQSGAVSVELNAVSTLGKDDEERHEGPLLEVYAPVLEAGTHNIIAVSETYVSAPDLPDQLRNARLVSWGVVGLTTLLVLAFQSILVGRGGATIDRQQQTLKEKLDDLSQLLKDNEMLRLKANLASKRVAEMNEQHARKIGTDLHDGPVQLLALSLLRLDSLSQIVASAESEIAREAEMDVAVIREAITETLQEIRSVSAGLAPPNVDKATLQGTLELACRRHERQTGSSVRLDFRGLPEDAQHPLKTCLYRFTQEGLSNSFRHGGGKGQTVSAWCDGEVIEVRISDAGPGLSDAAAIFTSGGSGMVGMRDRIEALGGDFAVESRYGEGTCITARFSVKEQ